MRKLLVLFSLSLLLPTLSYAATCPNLTRNLSFGSRGTDVTQLQTFLIEQGHLEAGNNTGFFGRMTEAAIKKFQCSEMQICSGTAASNGYGSVGPRTRAKIAEVCSGTVPLTSSPGPALPSVSEGQPGSACVPHAPQTQSLACSSGQSGSIIQTRTSSCPVNATAPIWGQWTTTSNTCTTSTTSYNQFQTTVVETNVPVGALFHSHSQHVVQNQHGIFVAYLTSTNATYDATWKLVRSTNNGASFSTVYTGTSEQNPPALETDTAGNIYVIYPTQTTGSNGTATFLKFAASNNFASPIVTKTIPNASSKFTTHYDRYRDVIYYFTANDSGPGTAVQNLQYNFSVLSLNGDVTRAVALTQGGSAVQSGVQYPQIASFGYDTYLAWTTDDSNPNSVPYSPHYRAIHVIKTEDGGYTFKKLDGTVLSSAVNTPIVADDTGPTDRITLSDEFEPQTWLSGFAATNHKLHFTYDAYVQDVTKQPDTTHRQHYVRINSKTGAREIDTQPTWCLEGRCIANSGRGGALITDLRNGWQTSIVYALSEELASPRPVLFRTGNNGDSWTLHGESNALFATNMYTVGAFRDVTSDGYVIGAFVQQNGSLGNLIFFRIPSSSTPAPQSCTPLPAETRTSTLCATGQTGAITERRTSSCAPGASAPTWSEWTVVTNSCAAPVQVLTYSWQAGEWSLCTNSQHARKVTCMSSAQTAVADSFCAQPKPLTSESCVMPYTSCGSINLSQVSPDSGSSYIWYNALLGGDSSDEPAKSVLQVLENGTLLGSAHSLHTEIRSLGAGRFSHWGTHLYFSASDNTNPLTNGKSYSYGVPPGSSCPVRVQ